MWKVDIERKHEWQISRKCGLWFLFSVPTFPQLCSSLALRNSWWRCNSSPLNSWTQPKNPGVWWWTSKNHPCFYMFKHISTGTGVQNNATHVSVDPEAPASSPAILLSKACRHAWGFPHFQCYKTHTHTHTFQSFSLSAHSAKQMAWSKFLTPPIFLATNKAFSAIRRSCNACWSASLHPRRRSYHQERWPNHPLQSWPLVHLPIHLLE